MINPQLLDYIHQQFAAGIPKEEISKSLIASGWQVSDINEAFASISPSPSTQMPVQNSVQPVVSSHKGMMPVVIAILLLVGAGGAFAAYHYGLFASSERLSSVTTGSVSSETSTSTATQTIPRVIFNTEPTKLLDLSAYDLEKSKKLWSEVSYFVFDGRGWFAQVPLVKKDETNGTIVTGFANGSVLESTDGYSMVSPDGKYAIIEHRQKVNGATMSVQEKYSVEEIATGYVILETPLLTDIRAIHFDNNSALHVVVREQQNIVWYKNNIQIMKTGIPAGLSAQDAEAWIKRTIFFDKQNLAMAWTLDGKPKIMLNGSIITPEWKYPDDPIVGMRIFKSIADNKIFYVAGGRKNMAFFVNEKETIGNLLNDNSLYLYPLLVGDAGLDYVADISSDGTRLAIVDTNGVTNSNIQQPLVRVLGKGSEVSRKVYPKGSRILDIKFSPDGNQFYYDAETDANDVNKRKVYAVINEVEQGPWRSIQDFQWSGNGGYAYVAMDEKINTVIVKNGQTAVTQPDMLWKNPDNYTQIGDLNRSINPENGKIFYVLERTVHTQTGTATETSIPLGDFQIYSTAIYDGIKSREYEGGVSGMNWGKSFFSPSGNHYVYLVADEKIIVIDGKEFSIGGDLLGSWSSKDGGFSDDGKWFGMYVMKENAVWWIPYNLEQIAKQQ